MNNTKEFAIALPGQGQYGMSYFGQIRQFNEFQFYPSMIQSTSMGSYQGQFLQFQVPFQKYFDFLNDMYNLFNDIFDYIQQGIESINNIINHFGFYDSNNIINVVKKYIPNSWDKMKIPIQMTSYDVLHGKEHIFGYKQDQSIPPYLQVVQSGCTTPQQTPIKANGTYYIDGGYMNNVPVNLIKNYDTKIMIYPQDAKPIEEVNDFITFLFKIVSGLQDKINKEKEQNISYIKVKTGVKDVNTIFDFHQYKENMELGYNNMKKFLNNNLHLFF